MPDLSWHYGPTDTDPDPGKAWHLECGKEVHFFDGAAICACGAQESPFEPGPKTLEVSYVPAEPEDPRIAQFERERAEAVELAHRAMATSYIGSPPGLRGDADRMVAALIKAGWTPPGGVVVEHAERYTDGAMLVRNAHPEIERIFPLADWIVSQQRFGGQVFKRRVIVVDDWTEAGRG